MIKGSLSPLEMTPPKVLEWNLDGVTSGEPCPRDLRRREDLAEPSSGEKAVSLVSGVPLKDSAPPTEERGEDGLKATVSRGCDMMPADFRLLSSGA